MRGATRRARGGLRIKSIFQSTRPMRGATKPHPARWLFHVIISIHAPHAGRDRTARKNLCCRSYFNPRAPCGARRFARLPFSAVSRFQSTRPMRGATKKTAPPFKCIKISIHAPHAGRDAPTDTSGLTSTNFNPRAPCGARHTHRLRVFRRVAISIHAPHAGRDAQAMNRILSRLRFQSTRPMRGATAKVYKITLHTFATKGNS